MRPFLIIGNWKANPDSPARATRLARAIARATARTRRADIVIAPPFPFLIPVRAAASRLKLGAQDMFWGDVGPFTGEVSWRQLKQLGVSHVVIGHSERRLYCGETDVMVNKKVRAALEAGLVAVVCVGEEQREGDDIPASVGEQLQRALASVPKKSLKNLCVAYEPVWAISTTPGARSDTPHNAFRAKLYIEKVLATRYDRSAAKSVRILYGGSVNAHNAAAFMGEGHMDGVLVGRASIDPIAFGKICAQIASLIR